MLFDAIAYALALDGLTHGGLADRSRISILKCVEIFPPNSQITIDGILATYVNDVTQGIL